jgi:hypothetical protein
LIAPPEKGQMEHIVSWLQDFTVQGMTPLAASLQLALEDFIFDASRVNSIVMLSDGIETCGGDPCQLVEDLKAQGINFTLHVIGLDVGRSDAAAVDVYCPGWRWAVSRRSESARVECGAGFGSGGCDQGRSGRAGRCEHADSCVADRDYSSTYQYALARNEYTHPVHQHANSLHRQRYTNCDGHGATDQHTRAAPN